MALVGSIFRPAWLMMCDTASASDAICNSKWLLTQEGERRFWPGPLIRYLETLEPQLALKWSIRLYQILLPKRGMAGSESEQQSWLSDVSSLIDSRNDTYSFDSRAHQIWANDQNLNLIERGIARLYWATANYQEGTIEPDYFLQLFGAVAMLVDNDASLSDMDEHCVEEAILFFQRFISEWAEKGKRE